MRSPACALAVMLAACAPAAPAPPAGPAPAPPREEAAAPAPSPPGTGPSARLTGVDARRVAAIEEALGQTAGARHDCWARAAADDYRLEGRVVLRVRFDDAGPSVTVIDDEPRDPVLASCLVALYESHAWPAVFSPGTAVELPFAFAAPPVQYTVQAEHVPPRDLGHGIEARVLLDEQSTGQAAVALSLITVRGELEMPLQGHARTTEMLYVLAGELALQAAGDAGSSVRVAAGQAAYIPPGLPYVLRHRGGAASAVQLLAPAGPQRQLRGQPPVDLLVGEAAAALPGAGALPVVRATPEVHAIAGGRGRVAFFFDPDVTGHDAAYLGLLAAEPGLRIPAHAHARETEMVLVLAGSGTMTVDGEPHPVRPMTAVQIPPGTEHAVEITGTQPLRALQVYTPSGPEQRFKAPRP